MQSKAPTVAAYLAELPADRRAALQALRKVINDNIDPTYSEGMGYGMMGWAVPHSVYPHGYHCDPKQPLPFCGMASQKGHMSLYLMCLYNQSGHADWFRKAWAKTGKKLDMGKSCIRFKRLDDLALDVIAESIRRIPAKDYIAIYERSLAASGIVHPTPSRAKLAADPAAKAKPAAKKPAAAKKKAATKR